jgi:hypothetical protein
VIRYVLSDTGSVFNLDWPGFAPSIIVFRHGGQEALMDDPDDTIEEDGETAALYRYSHMAFLDWRGKERARSGKYGFYLLVADGEYECSECHASFSSPPQFPYRWCAARRSGMHTLPPLTPEEQQQAHAAHLVALTGGRGG